MAKKVCNLFQNKYQSLSKFWVFFWENGFLAEKHSSAERKNGGFSVIPAGTRSVVIVGYSFMAKTVPPNFLDDGPKLSVLIIANWEWPEMGENRGEPRKMTPSSETEFYSG